MSDPHSLISTVAVGLSFAFVGGGITHQLRLPPLVGYLLAGIAVSPFTPGFVADTTLAPQLAEIGVIFLMFGVGMHFSINDLWAVRTVAVPGALGQIAVATALGIGMTALWGWPLGSGLLFGLALSVASTVVLLRALEDRDLLESDDGRIAVGWLIVEDLAMVLALVLLPAFSQMLGATNAVAPNGGVLVTLGITLAKVAVFVAVILVGGRWTFPRLLRWAAATKSRELFTLAVITLSLGVAFGVAELFGVSFALGAFFAGMVVHESDLSDRAARELQPLQDIFAALFFVSVGMLFDPAILVRQPFQVLAVLGIIVIGKSVAAFGIMRAMRCPVRAALIVSAGLAQVGEFSFILVALGMTLGLLPAHAQSLLVAGALLSITLNPLLFHAAGRWSSTDRSSNRTKVIPGL